MVVYIVLTDFGRRDYLKLNNWFTGIRDVEIDFLDFQPDDIIEVSSNSVFDIIKKIKNLVTM